MLHDLKSQCMNFPSLVSKLKLYSKLIYRFKNSPHSEIDDIEDIQNNLWVAIFEGIDNHYKPEQSLLSFAMNVLYSNYGRILVSTIRRIHNGQLLRNIYLESIMRYDIDSFESEIHTSFTLDQIQTDLCRRYGKSRAYTLAVTQFQYLRKGMSFIAASKKMKKSNNACVFLFNHTTRYCAKKYRQDREAQGVHYARQE